MILAHSELISRTSGYYYCFVFFLFSFIIVWGCVCTLRSCLDLEAALSVRLSCHRGGYKTIIYSKWEHAGKRGKWMSHGQPGQEWEGKWENHCACSAFSIQSSSYAKTLISSWYKNFKPQMFYRRWPRKYFYVKYVNVIGIHWRQIEWL